MIANRRSGGVDVRRCADVGSLKKSGIKIEIIYHSVLHFVARVALFFVHLTFCSEKIEQKGRSVLEISQYSTNSNSYDVISYESEGSHSTHNIAVAPHFNDHITCIANFSM